MANAPLNPDTPLNDKQRRFIDHYIATGHVTKAAIAAGYSPRSASAQGSALLAEPKIRREVDRRQANLANELGITRQVVLEGLLHEAQTGTAGASRVRAWELLGRAHGLFAERIDHQAKAEVVFKLEMGGAASNVIELGRATSGDRDVWSPAELGPGGVDDQ